MKSMKLVTKISSNVNYFRKKLHERRSRTFIFNFEHISHMFYCLCFRS